MSRYKGKSTLTSTYDVKYYGPLDTRFLVPTYADLTDPANWTIDGYGSNAYNGMIVAVGANESDPSKNGIYRLFDTNNPGAKDEPDVTNAANWHKLAEIDEVDSLDERVKALEESGKESQSVTTRTHTTIFRLWVVWM